MKKETENWITLAKKELKLAKLSLSGSEPIGVIYHLHASIEKALKGFHEEKKGEPPKIHSLKILAIECCSLSLEENERKLFDILDKAFLSSRYPIDIEQFELSYNINSCKDLINKTEESIKWLESLLKNN